MSESHLNHVRKVSRRHVLQNGAVATVVAGLGLFGMTSSAAARKKDTIPIDGPTEITEPGYYVLTRDITATGLDPDERSGAIEIAPGVGDVTIDGRGHTLRGEKIVDLDGVFARGTAVDSKSRNIIVKDLRVTQFGNGIGFRNVMHAAIRRVESFDNERFGVDCYQCDAIVVERNSLNGNSSGLFAQKDGRYTVCRNEFIGNGQGAVINDGIVDLVFERNNAEGNGNALFISEDATNPVIVNNTFSHNYRGIVLDESHGGAVTNNTVTDHENRGIELVLSEDVLVEKNRVRRNGEGIRLVFEANDNRILKNNVRDNHGDGIFIFGSDHNSVLNNLIRDNAGDGVDIRSRFAGGVLSGSDDNVVRKNTIKKNGGLPVRIDDDSTGNVVEDNRT